MRVREYCIFILMSDGSAAYRSRREIGMRHVFSDLGGLQEC